jgi:hypothetical protein
MARARPTPKGNGRASFQREHAAWNCFSYSTTLPARVSAGNSGISPVHRNTTGKEGVKDRPQHHRTVVVRKKSVRRGFRLS